ncbi:MAG: hypothetical protein OXL96_18530 [Candidatus Poribacteria bacterium]|nr:hypothetical protein [Candidatus Poribacteria bacterium]
MDENRQELLEIYKLHAELADKISQRREGANRLYVSLLTSILVFLVALLRFGMEVIPLWSMLLCFGLLGMLLSVSWYIVIRSYRQLNTGKFKALHELEEKLAYPFFKREWELLEEGENVSRYWKFTIVETFLPSGFFVLSLGSFILALILFCP